MAQSTRPKSDAPRRERLEARITPEQKSLILRAAEIEGRSVTDFVIATVQDAARRTLEAHATITLSASESRAFVSAMLEPPPLNDRVKDSVRRYREATGR